MVSGKSQKQTRDTQRQKIAVREATILQAATAVFAEKGVDGATMAEIARRAKVAEGTLYLYYRNKQDLLAGVVGHFWQTLTAGAAQAIEVDGSVMTQLRQLANYHLHALLAQFEVVALTYRARQGESQAEQELDHIRHYVRVYDRIIQRGIDRRELVASTPLWQSRDVFFGTLEFSARTLHLRESGDTSSVVENLLSLYEGYCAGSSAAGSSSVLPSVQEAQGKPAKPVSNEDLMQELNALKRALGELTG